MRLWGGIENLRSTHHVAATILMLVAIYHLVEIGHNVFVLRTRMSMLPGLQDVRDAWKALMYNLGLGKSRPQFGRYGFEEKAEYWALVWGILIMALTGFMMWNPLATIQVLPGEFIPAAKTAHGAEAVLAVLAIIVWHMYGVHIKRFNKSMWTGKLTEQEMLHEHPLELADIKAGVASSGPRRHRCVRGNVIYYPIAALVAGGLLFAVYTVLWAASKRPSRPSPPAISTVPVFVPQTPTSLPPTPTAQPSADGSANLRRHRGAGAYSDLAGYRTHLRRTVHRVPWPRAWPARDLPSTHIASALQGGAGWGRHHAGRCSREAS